LKTVYIDMKRYFNIDSDNISRVCINDFIYLEFKHVQCAIIVDWSYEVEIWNNVFILSLLQVIFSLSNIIRIQDLKSNCKVKCYNVLVKQDNMLKTWMIMILDDLTLRNEHEAYFAHNSQWFSFEVQLLQ